MKRNQPYNARWLNLKLRSALFFSYVCFLLLFVCLFRYSAHIVVTYSYITETYILNGELHVLLCCQGQISLLFPFLRFPFKFCIFTYSFGLKISLHLISLSQSRWLSFWSLHADCLWIWDLPTCLQYVFLYFLMYCEKLDEIV